MMKKSEIGRSMIEMMAVLALIGIITIGSITAYKNGQNQSEVNKITELVSIASVNGLTKMKTLPDSGAHNIWTIMGKEKADYKCISSLEAKANGQVIVGFSDCGKVKTIITGQWGSLWDDETNTYTPPYDDDED